MTKGPDYTQFDDEQLLRHFYGAKEMLKYYQDKEGRIEQEIMRRTEERGSKAIASDRYEATVETSSEFDQGKLAPLAEMLSPAQLEQAWVPEQVKTIPGKYDVRKLQSIARKFYGKEALEVIEQARIPGRRKLSFREKE